MTISKQNIFSFLEIYTEQSNNHTEGCESPKTAYKTEKKSYILHKFFTKSYIFLSC